MPVRLSVIHKRVHSCRLCPEMDHVKALRRTDGTDERAEAVLVSQALGRSTQRESGVPFFYANGRLGNSGRRLEPLLNRFRLTLYPPRPLRLQTGSIIPARRPHHRTVYCTEIAQCYPGPAARGDRSPSADEITTCLAQGFLRAEIETLNPSLILLMGIKACVSFFRHALSRTPPKSLTGLIDSILMSGEPIAATVFNRPVCIIPLQHASGVNRRFHALCEDRRLDGVFRRALNRDVSRRHSEPDL